MRRKVVVRKINKNLCVTCTTKITDTGRTKYDVEVVEVQPDGWEEIKDSVYNCSNMNFANRKYSEYYSKWKNKVEEKSKDGNK